MCRCECTAGYARQTNADGSFQCIDRNECVEFSALCNRSFTARNACLNLEGSFHCEFDVPNQCTADNSFANCWQKQEGPVLITSCEVRAADPVAV